MVKRAHLKARDIFRLLKLDKRYCEGNNEEPTSRVANEPFSITFPPMKTIRELADRELREHNKSTGSSHLTMQAYACDSSTRAEAGGTLRL